MPLQQQQQQKTVNLSGVFSSNLPRFNVRDISLKTLQKLRDDFEHTTESEDVGELDIHQFTELLMRHFSVSVHEAHDLFHEIDASNNGGIDWDELSTYLLFFKEDEEEEDDEDEDNNKNGTARNQENTTSDDDDENVNGKQKEEEDEERKRKRKIFSKSFGRKDRMMDITLVKDTTFRHADPTEGSFSPTSGFNHSDQITRLVCHQSVNKYFTASRDGTLRSWNSDTFELNSIFHYNRNNVWMNDMAICHSGKRVVAVGSDRTVSFYDCKTEALWKGYVGVPLSSSSTTTSTTNTGSHHPHQLPRSFLYPPGLCYPIQAKEIGFSRRKRRKMFREEQEKLERESEEVRSNLAKASGGRRSGYSTTTTPSSSRLSYGTTPSSRLEKQQQQDSSPDSPKTTSGSTSSKAQKKKLFYYSSSGDPSTNGLGEQGNANANLTGARVRPLEAEYLILNDLKCSAMSVVPCEREDREGPMLLGLENGSVQAYPFEDLNVHRASLNAKQTWKDLHPGSFVSALCYDSHLDCCFSGGGDGRIVALPLQEPKTIEITRAASQIISSSSSSSHHSIFDDSSKNGPTYPSSLTMRAIYRMHSIPEYRLLMSCGSERCVKLWSPTSGLMPPIILQSPGGLIVDCCQMKNEPLIVTLDSEKVMKLWDLRTQRVVNQWHDSDSYRPHNTLSVVATDCKRQRIVSGLTAPVIHHMTRAVVPFPEPWYKGHQKPIVRVLKAPHTKDDMMMPNNNNNNTNPNPSSPSTAQILNASKSTTATTTTTTTTNDAFSAATQKHQHSSSSSSNSVKERIVTACEECVKVWNVSDGSLHATWTVNQLRSSAVTSGTASDSSMVPGVITSIAFDQMGRRLVILTSNGCGFIVNFYNGLLLRELNPSKGPNTNKGEIVARTIFEDHDEHHNQSDDKTKNKKTSNNSNNNNTTVVNDLTPPPRSQHYQHVSNAPQNYAQQQQYRFANKVEGSYSQTSECTNVENLECSGERYVGCLQENNLLLWSDSQDGIAMDRKVDYILNVSLNYDTFCRLQPYRKGGAVHISEMSKEELLQEKRLWRNTMPTCLTSCPPLYLAIGTDAGVVLLFMMVPKFHLFRILGNVERTVTVNAITYTTKYDLLFAAMSDGRLAAYSIADRSICWSLDHREPLAERVPQLKSVCVLDRYVAATDTEGYVYFWSFYDDEDSDSEEEDDDDFDFEDADDESNEDDENDVFNDAEYGRSQQQQQQQQLSSTTRRSSAVFDSLQMQKKHAKQKKEKKEKEQKQKQKQLEEKKQQQQALPEASVLGKSKILIRRQQEHQRKTEQYLKVRAQQSSASAAANPTTVFSQTQALRNQHRLSLTSLFKTEQSLQLHDAKEAAKSSVITFLPSTCHTQSEVTFIGALRAHKEEASSCQLYYHFDPRHLTTTKNHANNNNNDNNNKRRNNNHFSSSSSSGFDPMSPEKISSKRLPPRSLFCATSGSMDCQSRVFDVFTGAFIGFCGSREEWRPHSGREQFLVKQQDYRRRSISGDAVATAVLLMEEKKQQKNKHQQEETTEQQHQDQDEKMFRQVSARFLANEDISCTKKENDETPSKQLDGIAIANDDDFFEEDVPTNSSRSKIRKHSSQEQHQQEEEVTPTKRRTTLVTIDDGSNNNNNNTNDHKQESSGGPFSNNEEETPAATYYEDISAISRDRIQKLTNTWSPPAKKSSSPNKRTMNSSQYMSKSTAAILFGGDQKKIQRTLSNIQQQQQQEQQAASPIQQQTVLSPLDPNDVGVDYYQLMSDHFVHLSRSMIRGIQPLEGSAIFDPILLANETNNMNNNNDGNGETVGQRFTSHNTTASSPLASSNYLEPSSNLSNINTKALSPFSKMIDEATTPRIGEKQKPSYFSGNNNYNVQQQEHEQRDASAAASATSTTMLESVRFTVGETRRHDHHHQKQQNNVVASSSQSPQTFGEKSILKASFGGGMSLSGGAGGNGDASFMGYSPFDNELNEQENLVKVKNLKAKMKETHQQQHNNNNQKNNSRSPSPSDATRSRSPLSRNQKMAKDDDDEHHDDSSLNQSDFQHHHKKNPFIKEDKLKELRQKKITEMTNRAKEDRKRQRAKALALQHQQRKTTTAVSIVDDSTNNNSKNKNEKGIVDRRDKPLSSEDFLREVSSSSSTTNQPQQQQLSPPKKQIPAGSSPLVEELLEMSMNSSTRRNRNQQQQQNLFSPSGSATSVPTIQLTANPRGSPEQPGIDDNPQQRQTSSSSAKTATTPFNNNNNNNKRATPQQQHHHQFRQTQTTFASSLSLDDNNDDKTHHNRHYQHRHHQYLDNNNNNNNNHNTRRQSLPPPDMFSLNPHSSVLLQHKKQRERQQKLLERASAMEEQNRKLSLQQQREPSENTNIQNNSNVDDDDDDDDDDLRNFLPSVQTVRVQHQSSSASFFSSSPSASAASFTARNPTNGGTLSRRSHPIHQQYYFSKVYGQNNNNNNNKTNQSRNLLPEMNQSAVVSAQLGRMKEGMFLLSSSRSPPSSSLEADNRKRDHSHQQQQQLPALDIARHGVRALYTEQRSSSNATTGGANSRATVPSSTTPSSRNHHQTLNSSNPMRNEQDQQEYDDLQFRLSEWQLDRQIHKLTAFIGGNSSPEHQNENSNDDKNNHNNKSDDNSEHQQPIFKRLAAYLPPLDVELRDEKKTQLERARNLGIKDGMNKGARDRSDLVTKELQQVTSNNVMLQTATGTITTTRGKKATSAFGGGK